jgi:hypothetical protein
VAPRPAVLPITQTSNPTRPAGIDLRVPPDITSPDVFRQPAPPPAPMVPIAVPAPPRAPLGLTAPADSELEAAVWGLDVDATPGLDRSRTSAEGEPGRRARRKPPAPVKRQGKGKAGAARLLVLALVVGAEGVAVTSLTGTARTHVLPGASDANSAIGASAALDQSARAKPAVVSQQSAALAQSDMLAMAPAQSESSLAKVNAAIQQAKSAKAAADRLKAAAERRARAARDSGPVPKGSAQAIAKGLLAGHGWSSGQFTCLVSLWNRESGWNYRAYNASSGAYGIPQALPGSKMASVGSDWRTNPTTQIRWGLNYIAARYGTPCNAWAHSQATGWY